MRPIFKYLAIFLPFSLFSQEVDQIEVVKVEVASIIWKNQKTSENFPNVDSNVLAEEVLVIESLNEPIINLENIEFDKNQIVFDFSYLGDFLADDEVVVEDEEIPTPSFYRKINPDEHELNGTMRRISEVENLELSNHKSWYQPLDSEENVPFILVSEESNQCIVKVFKSRFPRIHAKCAMGPDSLLETYKMTKSEYNVKPLIGNFKNDELDDLPEETFELFSLDEQRRINFNELHYFDHPKIGLLVAVYSHPKEDD
tara:strand:+ start:72 stop:842 length:771 start_codon:yes stop_codon:yes gene_type:complete